MPEFIVQVKDELGTDLAGGVTVGGAITLTFTFPPNTLYIVEAVSTDGLLSGTFEGTTPGAGGPVSVSIVASTSLRPPGGLPQPPRPLSAFQQIPPPVVPPPIILGEPPIAPLPTGEPSADPFPSAPPPMPPPSEPAPTPPPIKGGPPVQ